MSQILKSLQLPTTGSTPGTPPAGFGTLYASGSNQLYYKNPAGTEFNLTAGNGTINILYYTGSEIGDGTTKTYTWTKPLTGLKYIQVCCVGAGGGGGSGRRASTLSTHGGGGGGGGGGVVWATFDVSYLASSYAINIGAGGAGALGVTGVAEGNTGTAGNSSSFGNLVIARGGGGGVLGTQFQGVAAVRRAGGGDARTAVPAGWPHALNGGNGGSTQRFHENPPPNAPIIGNVQPQQADFAFGNTPVLGNGSGGGGVGGAFYTVNGVVSGSRGSSGYQFSTLITNGGFPGTASGQDASAPTNNMITTLLQFTGSTTLYGLGGGGHGGGYGVGTTRGGDGSNGGLYGAGGGGGGGTATGPRSGNGGSGSAGLCIIVEFY